MSVADLEDAGIVRMTRTEIEDFLAAQRSGVLGLPDKGGPYLLPLSYGFDREDGLYFTYLVGAESRKQRLSERAEMASFLVYTARTPFQWQSVLLTGVIEPVDRGDYDGVRDRLSEAWRPAVLESIAPDDGVAIYRFEITDRTGLKHTGLPPGLAADEHQAARIDDEDGPEE